MLFLVQLISISNIHKYIHGYIHASNILISIHACIQHTYFHTCMHSCTHTNGYMHACTYACLFVCQHKYMHAYNYSYIYICGIWGIRLEEDVQTEEETVAMYRDSLNRHKKQLKTTTDGWSFVFSFINCEVLTCNMLLQCAVMFCRVEEYYQSTQYNPNLKKRYFEVIEPLRSK